MKTLKNNIIAVVLLCNFHINVLCQSNYIQGKIVHLNGDTMTGLIDYRNWTQNPKSIKFKYDDNKEALGFNPLDIKYFYVNNERYISAIVDYETTLTNTNKLNFNSEPELRKDTTFLQAIILGTDKSLLIHVNDKGRKNFYIDLNGKPELLFYKKFLTISDHGKLVQIENKRYINQLKLYFNDCPQLIKNNRLKYKPHDLEKLFDKYFSCTNTTYIFRKSKDKFQYKFGVIAGISVTNLDFGGYAVPHLTQTKFSTSVNPAGGLSLDIIFPRYNRKISIYNELFFSTYRCSGNYQNIISDDEYLKIYSEFGFNYLKMNNMLRYKYPVGKFRIFASIGLSNGYGFVRSNNEVRESRYFSRLSIDTADALYSFRRYEQGYLLSLGTLYNKYTVELRMEKGNGMSNFPVMGSEVRRFSLLTGYTF